MTLKRRQFDQKIRVLANLQREKTSRLCNTLDLNAEFFV